jgi:hypothetical protein
MREREVTQNQNYSVQTTEKHKTTERTREEESRVVSGTKWKKITSLSSMEVVKGD